MQRMAMRKAETEDYLEKLCMKAKAYQQNIYELSCDYNRYEEHEHRYLKDFIGYALYGPPDCKDEKQMSADHFDYLKDQRKVIETIYNKALECSKDGNTSGTILCSVVFNVIIFEKAQFGRKATKECPEKLDIYPIPVFKVKSWRSSLAKGSCNFYIENNGRVYEGFENYLKRNQLPKCLMVYPKDGVYQADPVFLKTIDLPTFDCKTEFVTPVWLEHRASPAHTLLNRVCSSGDKLFAGAGIGCLIGTVGALFTPVGPVVGVGLVVGNGLTAAWSAGRSTQFLMDRKKHKESISLKERETIGAWLGVATGVFGIAGSASSVLLGRAVRAGTAVSSARILAHDATIVGGLVVNGVGLTVKSYDMAKAWKNGEGIDSFNVFLTCAHLFFFCNTVVNTQFARSFIATNQAQLLEEYKNNLRSNRHRKAFEKLVRNTKAAGASDMQSNEEIIRSINKIASKDEFFAAMVRNRKAFNAAGKKPTFSDGKISLGSGLTIDPVEFAKLPNKLRLSMLSFPGSATAPVNANVSRFEQKKVSDCNTYLKSQSWYQPEKSTQPNGSDIFNKILTQLQNVNQMYEALKKFVDIVQPVAKAVYEDMLEKERRAKSRKNRGESLKENEQEKNQNIKKMWECVEAVATYLWGYLCENLKCLISSKVKETNLDPQNKTLIEKCLNEVLDSLDDSVKKNLPKWVNAAYISV